VLAARPAEHGASADMHARVLFCEKLCSGPRQHARCKGAGGCSSSWSSDVCHLKGCALRKGKGGAQLSVRWHCTALWSSRALAHACMSAAKAQGEPGAAGAGSRPAQACAHACCLMKLQSTRCRTFIANSYTVCSSGHVAMYDSPCRRTHSRYWQAQGILSCTVEDRPEHRRRHQTETGRA